MLNDLIKSALVLLVSFAVRWFFAQIGVQIDDASFNTLVGAIVVWLLGLFGWNLTKAALNKVAPKLFTNGLLSHDK